MNKTVTINISAIIFHIEEDAYEKLNKYLFSIRGYFNTSEGRDEIMSDIESRIAELLKAKINDHKQVIFLADVEEVISIMGQPEDIGGGENQASQDHPNNETSDQENTKRTRRVFRDGENKVLGGVCSGLAAYFDLDPLWIRLALVVMFFGFGSGIILYLVLWIIIPEAKTTSEKLEMRGEKIDINNISKTVKEDAENFKNRMKNFGDEAKASFKKNDYSNRFVNLIYFIFSSIAKVLKKVVGIALILMAIFLTIIFVATLFGVTTIDNSDVRELIHSLFIDSSQKTWLILGTTLLIGLPAIMMMYKGVKLLFNFKYYNRWLNMSAGILWLTGLIICFYVGLNIASDFSVQGRAKIDYPISQPSSDTLVLKINNHEKYDEENYFKGWRNHQIHINNHSFNWKVIEKNNEKKFIGFPIMNIVASETDSCELYIIKSAKGGDKKEASERAKRIDYQLIQNDSVFIFNNFFTMNMPDKWRNQEVKLEFKIPQNKVIYLDKSLSGFIYDIENITNMYEGDMLGKKWKMTSKGLMCID